MASQRHSERALSSYRLTHGPAAAVVVLELPHRISSAFSPCCSLCSGEGDMLSNQLHLLNWVVVSDARKCRLLEYVTGDLT